MSLMLNASTLQEVLDMPAVIKAVENVFGALGRGSASQPTPSAMSVPGSDSHFILMPAVATDPGMAAVKLLADIPSNAQRSLPSQRSLIMLADQKTGEPRAVLDGRVPTRMRTAAATAVATSHLARPDSTVLGLIGAGKLAVEHVEAMRYVMKISKIVIWSRTLARIDEFRTAVAHLGLKIEVAPSVEAVFAEAEVVCTLTPAVQPIVCGQWFRAGQHINAVGARPRPTEREIDEVGMVRSRVFVDHRGTAQAKSGEYLMAVAAGAMTEADIAGELGEVVAGLLPGRRTQTEITLFNSVGIGALDLAIGALAYERARALGLGEEFNFSL